jgi:putative transposase
VARALGLSRSHLSAHRAPKEPRGRHVSTPSDGPLLARIRPLVAVRATYGYRRVTAMLNREHEPPVNHKRVYRVMAAEKLVLARHGVLPTRRHEGKVITPRSNMRWCSDGLEIRCWSGERVHVAFALDCCDREVVGWVAKAEPLLGEDIRDLMAESLEYRFGNGTTRAPRRIQWLSDNGPQYTAQATRDYGRDSGFIVCTTPSYSPESNGMAESFSPS